MAKPVNVSSTWTIVLKIFFPIFWGTIFGAMTIAFWLTDIGGVGGLSIFSFRLLLTSFFLSGMLVLYLSVIQLKRVEIDTEFVYVTNYKETARYPFHNLEKIEAANYYLFTIIRVYFKTPGIFGKQIVFLSNQFRFKEMLKRRSELSAIFQEES